MSIHLSKERYEATPHGALISWGVIENSPDGCYMTSNGPEMLLWSAWKGGGNDWAIYVAPFDYNIWVQEGHVLNRLHETGEKVIDPRNIARMIDAVPAVLKRYRR